jgi:hypothetical protein
MQIRNLLLNVNLNNICGQSSVLQHLITYSENTGIFPQHIDSIPQQRCYLYRDNPTMEFGGNTRVVNLSKLFNSNNVDSCDINYIQTLEESLSTCTNNENEPILESDFMYCLPSSVDLGNILVNNPDQPVYFTKQPSSLYVYDYNVWNNLESTIVVNKDNIRKLNFHFDLDPDINLDMFISKMGRKISPRMPSQASNFIKDKPIALVNTALEHGLEYAIEEGVSKFTKDFLSVPKIPHQLEEKGVTIFDISELTGNRSNSEEYYKYMCNSLKIYENTNLFKSFYDIFVKADTKNRLKTITRSDFLTNILCNETDTN